MDIVPTANKLSPARNNFRLTPMGNIYRSSFPSSKAKATSQAGKIHSKIRKSLSLNPLSSENSKSLENEELGNMTIELLRARLISERSAARSSKIKAEDLQRKVHELERSLAIEIERRKDAEAALQEALERLLHNSSSSESSGHNTDSELEILSRPALSEDGRTRYSHDSMTPGSSMRHELEITSVEDPPSKIPAEVEAVEIQEEPQHVTGSVESTHQDDDAVEVGSSLQSHERVVNSSSHDGTGADIISSAERNGTLDHEDTKTNKLVRDVHSDSDWATDDEGKSHGCQENQVVDSASTTLCLKNLDSDNHEEENKPKTRRESRLYLTEMNLVRKCGKHSIKRKTRSEMSSNVDEQEALSELTGWVNHVVNMLEARANVIDENHSTSERSLGSKHAATAAEPALLETSSNDTTKSSQVPRKKTSKRPRKALSLRGEPYVSFAKYLGLKNLDKLIQLQRDKNGATVWRIKSFPEVQDAIHEKREATQLVEETFKAKETDDSVKSSGISVKIPLQNDGDSKVEAGVCRHHLNLQLDIGIKSIGTTQVEQQPKPPTDINKGYDVEVSENNDFICMDISYKNGTGGSFQKLLDNKIVTGDSQASTDTGKLINDVKTSGTLEQAKNKCQSKLLGCFSSQDKFSDQKSLSSRKPMRSSEAESSSRSMQSADDKIEEIFKALNAAKQQLKNSIERRHVIETELLTSRPNSRAGSVSLLSKSTTT